MLPAINVGQQQRALMIYSENVQLWHPFPAKGDTSVIGCVTDMKIRLRTLLHSRRSTAYAVGSYANSMKGVTCDTSAS
jgi:hypothetical protein